MTGSQEQDAVKRVVSGHVGNEEAMFVPVRERA